MFALSYDSPSCFTVHRGKELGSGVVEGVLVSSTKCWRRPLKFLALYMAVLLFVMPVRSQATTAYNACMVHSLASVNAIVQGDYKAAGKYFSPAIANQLPPTKIEQVWRSVQMEAGKYQDHGAAQQLRVDGQFAVVLPATFAHAKLDFFYVCDSRSLITTMRLAPPVQLNAAIESNRRAGEVRVPAEATIAANGARVKSLLVPSPYGPLRGALTMPSGQGPFPAVVLIGGSGPSNLDEAVGGSKPFQDIADGLAATGIASLRYDKRLADYPLKTGANVDFTVDDEETNDALAALQLLTRQPQIDQRRVFVLGHSEGGMLAPRIGRRVPTLAGLILLAAPARQLLTVIQEQVQNQGQRLGLPEAQIQISENAFNAEQKLLAEADPRHPPRGFFGGAPQSWWLSLHDYNQVAVAESLSLPMLIMQGGGDFQVSPKNDFDYWKKALAGRSDVTFRFYPGLSHLFTPAGKTGTTADYKNPAHVDPKVITDIADWIKAQPLAKSK